MVYFDTPRAHYTPASSPTPANEPPEFAMNLLLLLLIMLALLTYLSLRVRP